MFKNMKLGMKLGLAFSIPVLFLILVGLGSTKALEDNNRRLETVYNDRVVPLKMLKSIADAYAVSVIDAINKTNNGQMTAEACIDELDSAQSLIEREWSLYLSTELTTTEEKLANQAITLFGPANESIAAAREVSETKIRCH